ncbi:hypothetical protein CJ030_MR8G024570 [Morella rubra]|uniref:Uncharacterized protein n=1 Tax=Morella rubra TaxID=262757 RepID=A0A6A1URK8_9ROSI|nr:hypothetical protein CJ030_MR8G024570 [Morella rubra]
MSECPRQIMHLILCSAIDPKKHTNEPAFHRVIVWREPVDMALYIYQTVRVKALKTNTGISLSYDILLTYFLHAMLVPEGANKAKTYPLRQINKATHQMLSDIIAWLPTLESMVGQLDSKWKKEVAAIRLALKDVTSGAQLHALTELVVLIEEHKDHDDVIPVGGKRLQCDSSFS